MKAADRMRNQKGLGLLKPDPEEVAKRRLELNPPVVITEEVHAYLVSVIMSNTGYKTDGDLNYYVEQNTRCRIMDVINHKYAER